MGRIVCLLVLFIFSVASCSRDQAKPNKVTEVVSSQELDTVNGIDQVNLDPVIEKTEIQDAGFNFWQGIAFVSLLINFGFFGLIVLYFLKKKKNKSKTKGNVQSNSGFNQGVEQSPFNHSADAPSSTISPQYVGDREVKEQVYQDDEKKVEVELNISGTQENEIIKDPEVPKILYAEKVKETGEFYGVSKELDPHKSFFKLFVSKFNKEEAEFEVMDSNFILRLGSNAPDIYLYNACDPENSNQDFTSEIITTSRGIAELVHGKWRVKQGNKAKIKFQ